MIISLIGYRGTGKSTVGLLLAQRLGWTCIDTDAEIQQQVGRSIREIFAAEGEAKFRQYETQVVQRLTRRHKLVLALGGGAVLDNANRQAIALAGPVVWLTASPATIGHRLAEDPQTTHLRPSLTGQPTNSEIDQLLQQRTPIYRACADVTIDTETRSPREIVDAIIAALDVSPEAQLS